MQARRNRPALAFLLPLAALAVAGIAIRVGAYVQDFTLDEVWSILTAESLPSATNAFALPSSNNHLLITLFIRILGPTAVAWYRMLPLAAGLGTIALLGVAARRYGRLAAAAAILFASFSYPLVLYSAEARGYAPAMFFALSALLCFRSLHRAVRPLPLIACWGSLLLGLLAQSSFLFVYGGLLGWSAIHHLAAHEPLGTRLRRAVVLLAVPSLVLATFYLTYLRRVEIFSGVEYSVPQILASLGGTLMGFPERGLGAAAGVLAAAAVLVAGVVHLARARDDEWILQTLSLLLLPIAISVAARSPYIAYRFFIVLYPFFYLLAARLIATIPALGLRRLFVPLILGLFICGQLQYLAPLLQVGRGAPGEALQWMARQTRSPEVDVASDHDFRNKILLLFYARMLPAGRTLHYWDHKDIVQGAGPEWLILHEVDPDAQPPLPVVDARGGRYRLARCFPHDAHSGISWFIYRRANR